ncbi:MAG TPA: glycogen-binding domain-containing protein [Gemmatimonadales bacterium]|jgi:hypothetical protein|nr:glycogen-binding domain-containing protein [Gemmatimonadales bacterium]
MTTRRIVCVTLALGCAVHPLAAQSAIARIWLGGGTATDLRGVRSGAYAVGPSVTFAPDPNFALSLGGRGTRFTNNAWSLGGSVAAALRVPVAGGFGLLLSGSGDAIRTSYRATYLSAEAVPALEWRRGVLSLWGGVQTATAHTTFDVAPLPGGPLPRPSSPVRSLVGPAFGGGLFLPSWDRGGRLNLSYREQHSSPDGVSVIDRTAVVGIRQGSLALTGSLGIRRAPDERRTFGAARLGITLTRGIELLGSGESYPSNRLTGAPGGRSFTVGIALGIGGPRPPKPLPKPAGVPAVQPGLTRLSLAAPQASRVEVAGDWSHWNTVQLSRTANGVWYVDLAIPPGVYRYAFRIDGKSWEVPKGVAAVNDGFGGKSAWLSVRGSGQTATQSANRKEAP